MIRILHIVGSGVSGETTSQWNLLARKLPPSEFEFHFCSLDGSGYGKKHFGCCNIKPAVIARHATLDPLAFYRLRQHIRQIRPDIVHTWQFDGGAYGRLAALSAGVRRLVASQQCLAAGRTDLKWVIDRRLASHTNRIAINSAAVRNCCLANGIAQNRLVFIPNAVLPTEPARLSRPDFLAKFDLPADAKLIVYLGPLVKEKRLKELIWAVDQLKAVAVPAYLLVVGDGPLRRPLERYRWLNRVDDRVYFLGHRSDASEILAHANVLWQAGTHEGQSSAIVAAMAAGVPVVATDAAGSRELVTNGVTGYLVPRGERAGFARWTLPLLEDAELARRFASTAKDRIQQSHRIEDIAAQYARMYRELIAE